MILVLIYLLLNTHLHILRERKETIKFLKEFLGCNLCITLGHAHVGMPQHLTHGLNRYTLFKRDERGKGVPCRMCGKRKRDASTKPQGFQIRLVSGISHEREQCFPFIAVELLHQPYGFGQQFDTTRHTCLVAVELQPKTTLVITHKMRPLQNSLFKICSFHHIFVPL